MEWLEKVMTVIGSGFLLLLAFSGVVLLWTWLGTIGAQQPVRGECRGLLGEESLDDLDDDDDESTRCEIRRLKRRLRRLEKAMEEHDIY